MYTSPIVFVRGKGESPDHQGSFIQRACTEQLSAVSTFERVCSSATTVAVITIWQ